ncbi:alpha-2-macroglobulin family protein [Litorimonas sp. WD9-15]|uniref:alpha-2-macroglobulin family protein n=1 Tax=Litorimonas sp. WD9-15 TaxID=3418716 RepID=UPI003D091DF9
MTSTTLKFGAGILLFLLAGCIGYYLFPASSSSSLIQADKRHPLAVVETQVEASPEPITIEDEPTEPAIELAQPVLRYIGWQTVDTNGTSEACLEFDKSFSAAQETDLKSYFRLDPVTPFSLRATAERICVLGLDYGQTYQVEVLEGLTADDGTILPRDRRVSVSFEDKPSFVGFAGDGIILPETKGARLTLKTVNVEKLDLTLYRINDRILSQYSPNQGEQGTGDDYVSTYEGNNRRVEVWSGKLDVEADRNQVVQTPFDLQDKISDQGPGAYILIARHAETGKPDYQIAKALRWIISTDLALTSYRGSDALHVAVRSIKTAGLQPGIRLDLIAGNNEQLAEVMTDGQGRAVFDNAILSGKGPLAPRMVMAYGPNGDYAVLDLSRAPLDLSTMDVQGREGAGAFDLYSFTDRGIYRPGETVHLNVLLRDSYANAIEGRTLTLDILRPDGSEDSSRELPAQGQAGGYVTSVDLPADAARGIWKLRVGVEGTDAVKVQKISVEDFVPQRLKLDLLPEDQPVLKSGETRRLSLDAQFYYGAPGSNLETEGEIRVQRDPNPFPEFSNYSFGDVTETYQEQFIPVDVPMTDDEGQAGLTFKLAETETRSTYPLRASVIAGVAEPGGRYVRENRFIPVRPLDLYTGFDPKFDGRADRQLAAQIDLISLNAAGERVAADLTWTLVKEERDYNWYRQYDRWQYRVRTSNIFMDKGEIRIETSAPTTWSRKLDWGSYRLETTDASGAKASFRFGVGWSNSDGSSDAPDRILIGATELPEKPGGAFTLNLKAPYAGRGDIVIADHTVRTIRTVEIPEGASSLRLPYDPDWGHDVYAMVTLYTAFDDANNKSVKRAVGLTHIGLDRSDQTLDIAINAPDRIAPRVTLEVPIEISGAAAKEKAWVSLAAVDEGILALTNFRSPDAAEAFFSKKAFTLDIRDDYARILNPYLMQGAQRSGGDSIGGAGLSVVPTQTVALFQGPLMLKNGKATISLDLPDFNGELRLMVTAWTKSAVGSASQPIKVRDSVPANLSLPRFLAPGDTAVATLALDNIDGASGVYRANIAALGLLEAMNTRFDLQPGTRDQTGIYISDAKEGIYNFTTKISGPGGYAIETDYPIEVRSPYRPILRRSIHALEPGESFALNPDRLDGYNILSADVDVSVARLPGLSVQPYLSSLSRYPYGCTEQTVSSAMPLLFVENLGGFSDTSNATLRQRIQSAIAKVSSRQSRSGEFGLWSEGDGYLSPWLQLYVSEFLVEAEKNGFEVSEAGLSSALDAAKSLSLMEDYSNLNLAFPNENSRRRAELRRAEQAAYAHYVLALAGRPDASGVRYVNDRFGKTIDSPIAQAYLGAALSRIGDAARAEAAFTRAQDRIGDDIPYDYYDSAERDAAAVLAIGGNDLSDDIAEVILLRLADLDPAKTSTQEKSYIVRAMSKITQGDEAVSISSKGIDLDDATASLLGSDMSADKSIMNTGDSRLYVTLDIDATPLTAPEPISAGFDVKKTLYSPRGEVLSVSQLQRGDRVVVLLEARSNYTAETMMVMADLLPAGLEIETVLNPPDAGEEGAFKFLGELSEFDMQEARDDRFIASDRWMKWERDRRTFRAAYIARAVTVGDFIMPALIVEDMYRPTRVGTSKASRITIDPAGSN